MFDITKLYPYWRTYQEMNLMRTGPLFYLLKDIEGFNSRKFEVLELLIFSCSKTGLTFILDQYLEFEQVNKIIEKIQRHHVKKIRKFQRKLGTANAINFESALSYSFITIGQQVEYCLRYKSNLGKELRDTADTALMFLFNELMSLFGEFSPNYSSVDEELKQKLIDAMIPVIHYTLEDCKELGIITPKTTLKKG